MKRFKRLLSGMTALAMFMTGWGSFPVHAETTEETGYFPQTESDISFHANNALGEMLLAETEETNKSDFSGAYGISEIKVENGNAVISYYAEKSCEIVLGFYSDNGRQMYTSCTQTLIPSENTTDGNDIATIPIPADVPEFYLLKGYLIDSDFAPLCESYSSTLYTEEITRIRNSTVSDFDESLVFNLDEDPDTNFLVLLESTIQIPYHNETNLLESYDETNGIYVFSNIDETISNLSSGDVVFYPYQEQQIVFTVSNIIIEGSTATIQEDDMELTDAFSLVKIEQETYGVVEDENADMGDGLTYLGTTAEEEVTTAKTMFPLAKAEFNGKIVPQKAEYQWELTLKKNETPKNDAFKGSFEGTVKASFTFSIPIEWDLYISLKSNYAKISIIPEISAKIKAEAELKGTLYLKKVEANLLDLVGVESKIGINFSGSISAETSLTISQKATITVGKGLSKLLHIEKPKIGKPELDIEGSFYVGIVNEATGTLFGKKATATVKCGAEFTGKPAKKHICNTCIAISADLKYSATMKYTEKEWKLFNKEVETTSTKTIAEVKVHIYDRYWSITYGEHGWGECPHMNETTTSTTATAQTSSTILDTTTTRLTTNTTNVTTTAQTITTATETTPNDIVDFGIFDNDFKWILYTNGKLVISGSGEMTGFYVSDFDGYSPWYNFRDKIKEVIIEDGMTSLASGLFEGCMNLTLVKIADSVEFIGRGAFADCSNVVSINIPDNVIAILKGAFVNCTKLKEITLPDSLTGIGEYTFSNCTSLTSITLPQHFEDLPEGLFKGCTNLTSIVIPQEVTSIGEFAFKECSSLTDIYYTGTEEQWKAIIIYSGDTELPSVTIHYNTIVSNTYQLYFNAQIMESIESFSYNPLAGDATAQTITFEGLTAGATYNFYSMVSRTAENPLNSENLLYINQYTADENGILSVSFIPTQTAELPDNFVVQAKTQELGDVNGDGNIDASDASEVLIASALIGAGDETGGLTEKQFQYADVNNDSNVNATDASMILIYSASLGAGETDLPLKDFFTSTV